MVTESEILNDVLGPNDENLDAGVARAILELQFSDETKDRIRSLLDAKNRGEITDDQDASLAKYLRVGQLIDLFQAKARLSLKK